MKSCDVDVDLILYVVHITSLRKYIGSCDIKCGHVLFCRGKNISKIYQAKPGFLTNTIPGSSDSIGASKMYILEKRILGTQISMLGFYVVFGILCLILPIDS